jgi:hypothetical protein
MSDLTTPQDGKAMSPVSAGSAARIDAHELMCELHHIAGSEQHDPDVRRTASDAELAIARLIDWVHQLQLNAAERDAIKAAADFCASTCNPLPSSDQLLALRRLLERLV